MPQPPAERAANNPRHRRPRVFGIDYSHAEVRAVFGKDPRVYAVMTKESIGDNKGNVKALVAQVVHISSGRPVAIEGREREWPCDLTVLSMGFLSPEDYVAKELDLDLDQRNNIRTSIEGVFAAGDCRRGQSLVVWAIHEGRGVADAVDGYLKEKRRDELEAGKPTNVFANLSSISPHV